MGSVIPPYQTDFSVFKNTKITERFTSQLRLEVFNLFNNRNLGGLGTTLGSNLGKATATQDIDNGAPGIGTGAPRNVQLALKLLF